jgi:hypothetical protein
VIESREAAQLVLDAYGEPEEFSPLTLTWHTAGRWKRIVATQFEPGGATIDLDARMLSDEDLKAAVEEGKRKQSG